MKRKHTVQLLASLAAIAALVVLYMVPLAFAQDDMTEVPADGFATLQRPRVAFEHDAHNEKAELEDCVICHHSKTEDGKQDLENSSEGEPCSSCHAETRTDGGTPLMRAYHKQCIGCHKEKAKGPVACGECHAK
ncbi:cytochrome C [Pseudodesulfovibrio cashew]|uniref:Cytochrome C n=1 Tax=Pseudodesulfovibrio cashew TaxID=2678688 RepID=A0A6I6JFC6_9BACT|nr:cytochrome c3 family protein [Pseudodesulfovibrio cashew]QGY38697.1 cytochrome C [Pseudodesulfovibrio cashew]